MTTKHAADFKARKEAFVSNLSGSTITEINLVTLVASTALILWTGLQKRYSFFTPYNSIALVTDFLLNVCAILFAVTVYASAPAFLNLVFLIPGLLLLSPLQGADSRVNGPSKSSKRANRSKQDVDHAKDSNPKPGQLVVRPFLTSYRGAMMIVTCLAILAVDFPIFPRRFAKVETWGTSLMDLGVGSFIFSAGVVSARSVLKVKDTQNDLQHQTFGKRFYKALRHSLPLLVLGMIRLYSVKGLDYAEHVTEYGVHWNFFFTLALMPPFVELSDSLTRYFLKSYELLALVLGVSYEIILNNTNLLQYILISPRGPDLLSKNREGVFSFIGYLAIFLAGRGTGSNVISLTNPGGKQSKNLDLHAWTRKERSVILYRLFIRAVVYTALFILMTSYSTFNLTVSRRLANLPYVLWTAAFNNAQILFFGLIEAVGPQFTYQKGDVSKFKNASSGVMQVFNKNGLLIFLVANLFTGLVNMTVNTLDMSNVGAMIILIAYAAIVTGFAMGLDMSGLKIKL